MASRRPRRSIRIKKRNATTKSFFPNRVVEHKWKVVEEMMDAIEKIKKAKSCR